ncbi:phage tail protein [Pararhodonellum marinum]|uniref:phage tail protein n=1 Tax=Pararhodonellum marinum TaxID=2755358 RepID=UPI00188FD633|nr:phage tail protein [Pararhodonellum marinum]
MADGYQIAGFHFRVNFHGLPALKEVDVGFQSVSGLDVKMEMVTYREGGENKFEHRLPGRTTYSTLTLKRGILTPEKSALTNWLQDAFQGRNIIPLKIVQVDLLNENHEVLMQWELHHVWPVNWTVGELHAEKGEVLIETLELSYNGFELRGTGKVAKKQKADK